MGSECDHGCRRTSWLRCDADDGDDLCQVREGLGSRYDHGRAASTKGKEREEREEVGSRGPFIDGGPLVDAGGPPFWRFS